MISMSKAYSIRQLRMEGDSIAEISRKLEVSRKTTSRYLTIGRPPTEVDCAVHRKHRTRPLRIASHPASPIRTANPARASHRHPFTTAQTHASSIRPRNKQLLGEQSQTAATN